MLIPKCCKGCSSRKSGICNCLLPLYCDEWVEDDETYPTNVGGGKKKMRKSKWEVEKIYEPFPELYTWIDLKGKIHVVPSNICMVTTRKKKNERKRQTKRP